MKRIFLFSMVMMAMSFLQLHVSWAVVKFADEAIKTDFEKIFEKYELIQKLYAQLSASELTYIIRYGNVKGKIEGLFETDGQNFYLTFKKHGEFSLQAQFAHEATHTLQFEAGRIGFFQDSLGQWKPVNIDLWDEAEAFQMMAYVATGADLSGSMGGKASTNLYRFKKKLEDFGFEKAARWLKGVYPKLSLENLNNPTTGIETLNTIWQKRGCKFFCLPYQSEWALSK